MPIVFFIINGIFFFSSPSLSLLLLLSSVYVFLRLFIHLIFSHRVPSNLFQKLLLHIFEKRKRLGRQQDCLL